MRNVRTIDKQEAAAGDAASLADPDALLSVMHELRTPLSVLRLHLDLLEAEHDPERVGIVLRKLQRGITTMESLISNVARLAAIEAGREHLSFEPVDLVAVVSDAVSNVDVLLSQRGQTAELSHEELPVIALGDASAIERMTLNLLLNAAKYGTDDDVIYLGVWAIDGRATVTVTDHGPGIAPGEKDLIFQRYARGTHARSRQAGGNGIGLALVKALAEAQGGQAGVTTQKRGSTSFWFTLPLGTGAPITEPSQT